MSRKSSPNHSSPEVTRDAPSNSSLTREATPDKIKILDSFNSSAGATYSGSPGHTPFPKAMPIKLFNDDSLGDASISIESSMATSANESGGLIPAATPGTSSESFHLPKVPFNSPDEVDNNEAIIAEAKRQEELLRESLTADNLDLLLAGQSPSLSAKRRKIDFIKETREDLNEDANKESKFVPVTWESLGIQTPVGMTARERYQLRKQKHQAAMDQLRANIPGLTPDADDHEVLLKTTQYIVQVKQHVGYKFDREFLEAYKKY